MWAAIAAGTTRSISKSPTALKSVGNTLHICVWDGTEQNCQPVGKQIMPENRQGFRYQPTGGIWQSVWLEAVPKVRLASLKVTPRLDGFEYSVRLSEPISQAQLRLTVGDQPPITVPCDSESVTGSIVVNDPKLWTPDSPHLYDLSLELIRDKQVLDCVKSYVGLRTISRDATGRILLNGRPVPLMLGPLDQGYWPDGILTPPHEDAIKFDLEYLKSIGCNMVRVHVKVHPRRWYYHADHLGFLVWQDMVCTPKYGQTVDKAGSENWRREFAEIIDDFYNHPSIVQWVLFNEAWGQHDTKANTQWAANVDRSRLIISASGWNDHGAGDSLDVHNYTFYPSAPIADGFGNRRALVFGELGGHNLLLTGRTWYPDQQQPLGPTLKLAGGRMNFNSLDDLAVKYPFYFRNIRHFHGRYGYQGLVYTQLTDIEHECNGWLTYDRRVSKLPAEHFRRIHQSLTEPVTYAPLVDGTEWQAGRVRLATPGSDAEPRPWTVAGANLPEFSPLAMPHQGGPIAPAHAKLRALGPRRQFTIDAPPKHAVLEVRAAHRDAFGNPPRPKMDGPQGRALAMVRFVTYFDGKLHRRNQVAVERGQGEGVTFLELTHEELRALTPGEHTLAIEIQNPEETVRFDAQLWQYTD